MLVTSGTGLMNASDQRARHLVGAPAYTRFIEDFATRHSQVVKSVLVKSSSL
jgi:hypothetical protein